MTSRPLPVIAVPADGAVPGVDEHLIERLVRHFYDRIRADAELGPIFADVITGDWEPHLQVMMAFWSSVMLKSGRFQGQPMQKHQALKAARPEHFTRWLALFAESAAAVCEPAVAEVFASRARDIADSLQRGMFAGREPGEGADASTSG